MLALHTNREDVATHTRGYTPCGTEHEQANEHNHSILNQTPSTPQPVAKKTDQDLTNDNANDFEVSDGLDPYFLARSIVGPTVREGCSK